MVPPEVAGIVLLLPAAALPALFIGCAWEPALAELVMLASPLTGAFSLAFSEAEGSLPGMLLSAPPHALKPNANSHTPRIHTVLFALTTSPLS
jgi:hypothetical protein